MGTQAIRAAWAGVVALAGALLLAGCVRPSDSYEVDVYGAGTPVDDILPAPTSMGGLVELARVRLWGSNLGFGLVGPFADQPRADGQEVVTGSALFGFPKDPAFDRNSTVLGPGPRVGPREDACVVRTDTGLSPFVSEYVDVGDAVTFTADDGLVLSLPRDPARFPEPAGDAWYVGYGGAMGAVVQDHPDLADTWRESTAFTVGFPGGFPPESATVGAIPVPMVGASVRTPGPVADLRIDDVAVRAPHHGYNDNGVWVGEDVEDPVRFAGPWDAPLALTWTPGTQGDSLTVVVRILGYGAEADCACGEDCGAGFTCDQGVCAPVEGSGWVAVGELACTVADDGAFALTPALVRPLLQSGPGWERAGVALAVGRMIEGEITVPDVRSNAGRRIPITPVRTRTADLTWTRLEAP